MEGLGTAGRVTTKVPTVIVVSNHGDIVGGGEISLLTLLKGLNRSRWDPVVVVPSDGDVARRCRALGIPTHVIPLPSLRLPGSAVFRSIAALRRLARDTHAMLFHANGSRALFYAGLAGRLTNRPVVWHLRLWRPDPLLDWLLARLATRTIATSEAVRTRLQRWPEAHRRCSVVPNGIDVEAFTSSRDPGKLRETLGVPSTVQLIGTVGRLVPFKGHRYLLEAMARLRERSPAIHLLIVGEGPERETLEQAVRDLGIAGAVKFLGHRTDVADLLALMEVFVLPSEAEDFGRVLLEAMVMGRPIVATASGGVPEIVLANKTGLLVPPADPAGLAGAVSTLLGDPDRAQAFGQAGRRRVEEHYHLRQHAELVEAVYAETAQERT